MAVSVQCPGCFSTMQVAEEKLGAKVKCRTCSQVFVARGGGSAKAAGKNQSSRSKKPRKGSSSGNPVGLIAGLAAVVVLGIGAYVVFGRGGGGGAEGTPAASSPQASAAPAAVTPAGTAATPGAATVPAPSAVWNVVDPPKLPLEWTRSLNSTFALPANESKPVFPALSVPFFATSSDKGFTVFDLRNGTPVKHVD